MFQEAPFQGDRMSQGSCGTLPEVAVTFLFSFAQESLNDPAAGREPTNHNSPHTLFLCPVRVSSDGTLPLSTASWLGFSPDVFAGQSRKAAATLARVRLWNDSRLA
jgi:hypothetical protein